MLGGLGDNGSVAGNALLSEPSLSEYSRSTEIQSQAGRALQLNDYRLTLIVNSVACSENYLTNDPTCKASSVPTVAMKKHVLMARRHSRGLIEALKEVVEARCSQIVPLH